MSAVATPTRTAARPAALTLSSEAVVIGAVCIWFAVLAVLTWGTWGDPSMDTGYDLLAATRTSHGELPYVDYVYYYGPLAPLLLGGVYVLTGTGIAPAAGLGLVLAALAVGLTYRLARLFTAPPAAGLAAALVATAALSSANNSYVLPHSTSGPLATVLTLGVLIMLSRFASDGGVIRLVTAGILLGLLALTRVDYTLVVGLAVTAWLAVRVLHARHDSRRAALKDAIVVLAPAVGITFVVYGAFATAMPVRELLFDNLYPVDQLRAAGNVVLRNNAPLTAGSGVELVAYLVLYAFGVVALVAGAAMVAAGGRARRLALFALAGAALALVAVLVVRPDTVRYYLTFAYAWIPAGAVLAAAVLGLRALKRHARPAGLDLLLTLTTAGVAALTYANFRPFPNAEHPSAVAYAMPFAALFLVWLHVVVLPRGRRNVAALGMTWIALLIVASAGLVIHDARQETMTVSGPGGSMTARPADAAALQGALDAIRHETRTGEPVLLVPQLTSLYVMADRPDPLRQLSLLPGALETAADERAAIARMGNVRLVVADRTPLTLYDHGSFGTTFDRVLSGWLRSDFVRVASPHGEGAAPRTLDVWRRTSP